MPLRGGTMAEQPLHAHVVSAAVGLGDEVESAVYMHGGHLFVATQQPLLPGLEPSAHVAASSLRSLRFEAAVTWIVTSDLSTPATRAMSCCKSNLRLS
eukprot:scaffold72176_cov68-Phaeocystis_antarctica.AAC.1